MKRIKTGLGYKEILEEGDWVRFDGPHRFPIEGCLEAIDPDTKECLVVGQRGQEFYIISVDSLEFVS